MIHHVRRVPAACSSSSRCCSPSSTSKRPTNTLPSLVWTRVKATARFMVADRLLPSVFFHRAPVLNGSDTRRGYRAIHWRIVSEYRRRVLGNSHDLRMLLELPEH